MGGMNSEPYLGIRCLGLRELGREKVIFSFRFHSLLLKQKESLESNQEFSSSLEEKSSSWSVSQSGKSNSSVARGRIFPRFIERLLQHTDKCE